MKFVLDVLPFVAIITPVVFFHELGHFSVARLFGVRVETFSIGFGPAIAGWTDRKGTRWKISWIPLGGYVKFFGDADATSRPDHEAATQMTAQERSVAFPLKPVYQRALIVAAGPAANFILSAVIFTTFFTAFGVPVSPAVVQKVLPGSAAQAAGFQSGDQIMEINGSHIDSFDDVTAMVAMRPGELLNVTVDRGGRALFLRVTPRLTVFKDQLGEMESVGRLGIQATSKVERLGPAAALREAGRTIGRIVRTSLEVPARLFTSTTVRNQVHGPLGIMKVSAEVAQISVVGLLQLAAYISVSVGLINLFPIPLLDGGHLLYYACEGVLGRPLGARVQDLGYRLGLAVMILLMLLATRNDLARLNVF
jgi:regulator of sigma E protease